LRRVVAVFVVGVLEGWGAGVLGSWWRWRWRRWVSGGELEG